MEQPLTQSYQTYDPYTTPSKPAKEGQLSTSIYLGTADTTQASPGQQTGQDISSSVTKQQEEINNLINSISDTRKQILSLSNEFSNQKNSQTQFTNNYSTYVQSPVAETAPTQYIEVNGRLIPIGGTPKGETLANSQTLQQAATYTSYTSQLYTPSETYKQEVVSATKTDTVSVGADDLYKNDRTFEELRNHPINYITKGDFDVSNPVESMEHTIDHMNRLLAQMREKHSQMNSLLTNSNWTKSAAYINETRTREVEPQSVQYREIVEEQVVKRSAPVENKKSAKSTKSFTLPSLPKVSLHEIAIFKQIKTLFERKPKPVVVKKVEVKTTTTTVEKKFKSRSFYPKEEEHVGMRAFVICLYMFFFSLLICQAIGLDNKLYALDGIY